MNDLININGHICKNCNEINVTDYTIGLIILFLFILISKIIKHLRA
jgi:hypothetical protein